MKLTEVILKNLNEKKDELCYWWEGVWYSRGDLIELVEKCEKILIDSGFEKGQRLVVMMKNSPLIPALSLAVWKLGGAICPLNEKFGFSSLKSTLDLIKPFAIISQNEIKELEELKKLWPCVTCDENLKIPEFKGKNSEPDEENFAVIFATSGTTGNPKAVPLTHENLLNNCEATREKITALAPGDIFLDVLPNFHSFGYTVTTMLPLFMNAKIAIVPSFLPPQGAMKAIAEAKVNVMFVVPAIMAYLLMAVEKNKFPAEFLTQQKLICTGGDRLNPNIHDQALRLIKKDIVEGYGLTETSPVVCMCHNYESYREGSVGTFLTGYEHKLRTRDGKDTDSNEGVLWLKGPSVTKGYYHAPEITNERFEDGWFNSGDYVNVDDEGYVTILDRVTDIIIVGGFNVYPQEVEKVLSEHPAVHTAIVVGIPHAINGEVPKAYIQRKEGFETTDREIIKYAKSKLAHFKVPRSIEFVDEFPLSGTGKILRRVLRERAGKKSI